MPKLVIGVVVLSLGLALGACGAVGPSQPEAATLPAAATVTLTATFTPAPSQTPTSTATATATATETPAPLQTTVRPTWLNCSNDLALVLDLNQPGQPGAPVQPPAVDYEQRWRVRNTGTCTWDNSYSLAPQGEGVFLSAGSTAVPVMGQVKPGELYDFSLTLVTPLLGGVYQAAWRLQDGSGTAFGEVLQTTIQVAAITPDTSASEVVFRASPLQIEPDGRVAFAWDASQAKEAYFYRAGQAWQEHRVPLKGATYEYPQSSAGFLLRVVKADDSVEVQKIQIEILPLGPPVVVSFALDPEGFIFAGDCVLIYWDTTYHAKSVDIFRDDIQILTDGATYGKLEDCPPGSGTVVRYKLVVSGVGGTTTRIIEIEVR
jgi:hypothetical protein